MLGVVYEVDGVKVTAIDVNHGEKIKPPELSDLFARLKTTYDSPVAVDADRMRFIIGTDAIKVIAPAK